MKKLDGWVGTWEGTGWYKTPGGHEGNFKIRETVESDLGGLLLVVHGLGTGKNASGVEGVVHQAFGVISYDSVGKKYRFIAATKEGRYTETELKVTPTGYEWGMATGGSGAFRYTVKFAGNDWHELGEWTPDGSTWSKFSEMKLTRVK
jgi:hypothetical protein